ncbi:MAG: bifunctional riboflavin kinase/FAD synthetase [Deltaproteobacteria bacterium]|nr:bifunctional riboflavin kinase/FAD synthetase [Deltaproteobacteria bacterium]
MQIIRDLNHSELPLNNPVLTIGNFDGVHEGHKALFRKVRERAGALNGQSVVMTFEPHPIRVMKPGNGPPMITPTRQKLELIGRAGIDVVFSLPFTREFAAVTAEDFVKRILIERIGIREIVVGYDYSFGAGRKGDIALLKRLGEELGFEVHVVEPITIDGMLVSSTSIRDLVRAGDLDKAGRLLGRNYQICGTVITGHGRGGRLLGVPTANLEPVDELVPREGVYAVLVRENGRTHHGVTNIGNNPTFGDREVSVETHLLDFSGDLVGKTIRIDFLERLRDEKAFESFEELSEQIARDIQQARGIFENLGGRDRVEPGL